MRPAVLHGFSCAHPAGLLSHLDLLQITHVPRTGVGPFDSSRRTLVTTNHQSTILVRGPLCGFDSNPYYQYIGIAFTSALSFLRDSWLLDGIPRPLGHRHAMACECFGALSIVSNRRRPLFERANLGRRDVSFVIPDMCTIIMTYFLLISTALPLGLCDISTQIQRVHVCALRAGIPSGASRPRCLFPAQRCFRVGQPPQSSCSATSRMREHHLPQRGTKSLRGECG